MVRTKEAERLARAARLKRARLAAGFSGPKQLHERFGWNVNTYKAHESGRNGFEVADGRQYARAFGVSLAWLLSGEGDPQSELEYHPLEEHDPNWRPEDGEAERGAAAGEPYKPRLPGASPEVDARIGAGPGQVGDEIAMPGYTGQRVIDEWVFPPSYLRELRARADMVWILPVVGNSMEPVLSAGDRVLVDTTHTQPFPDGVYAIDEGGGPEAKQLQLIRGSSPPQVRIISANQSYPTRDRALSDVRIVGRVCGRVSRM